MFILSRALVFQTKLKRGFNDGESFSITPWSYFFAESSVLYFNFFSLITLLFTLGEASKKKLKKKPRPNTEVLFLSLSLSRPFSLFLSFSLYFSLSLSYTRIYTPSWNLLLVMSYMSDSILWASSFAVRFKHRLIQMKTTNRVCNCSRYTKSCSTGSDFVYNLFCPLPIYIDIYAYLFHSTLLFISFQMTQNIK